jgi:hypothetical protein
MIIAGARLGLLDGLLSVPAATRATLDQLHVELPVVTEPDENSQQLITGRVPPGTTDTELAAHRQLAR